MILGPVPRLAPENKMTKILFSSRLIYSIQLMMLMLVFCADHAAAEEQCAGEVCFNWAFGALKGNESDQKFIKIARDTELQTGDKLKMLVRLNNKCFVYVFYHSSQDELYMLFPYDLSQFSNDYEVSKNYYIPQGNYILELDDHVGKEKFYLVASAKRLHELENLFASYDSEEGLKKPEFMESIIQEIRNLRKRHKKFTIEAERPIASTGTIRAHVASERPGLQDLDKIANKFIAQDFFAKTFTIDHK